MGKIIDIAKTRERLITERFVIKDQKKKKCNHRQVHIDEEQRIVCCDNCNSQLDPIWVLLEWLKEDQSFKWSLERKKEMMIALSQTGTTQARKPYECGLCKEKIKVGDNYYRKMWNKICCCCVDDFLL